MRELLRYVLVPALIGGLVGLAVIMIARPDASEQARPGYAAAVKRAAPAVVNIYSSKVVKPPICQLPRFREWCDRFTGGDAQRMQSALGSGVVVREDGYILTNNHVIAGADEILVGFSNGETTAAALVGSDPETDLALIRVPVTGLSPIPRAATGAVEVGDLVLAIGNPFGIGQTVSAGIISAKGRAGISPSPYDDFIQTDAAINPGNSGGALVDTQGNFVGLNTLIYSSSGTSAGIGFAIPAELALSVLDELVSTGRVTRGWLGVEMDGLPRADDAVGLTVTRVLPGGPADQAGLLPGDIILAVNGQPATDSASVSRLIAMTTPGSDIQLTLLRRGSQRSVVARSGQRPPTGRQ
jgi:serine protease DegS